MVCAACRDTRTVAATFDSVLGGQPSSAAGSANLKEQLDLVAQCVKAGVPTRVYAVSLDGFDTHAGEKSTQSRLLAVLDSALSSFLAEWRAFPAGAQ